MKGNVTAKLSEISEIRAGYPFRSKIESVPEGNYRVIQIKDIRKDTLRVDPEGLFRVTMPPTADQFLVHENDVLFQARGSRNFATPISQPLPSAIASGHLFVIRPKGSVLAEYLAWYMNQPTAQAQIKEHQRGSYVPLIPKSAIEELQVPVPPTDTQRVIVALERLRLREEQLQHQLSAKRTQLFQSICMNLIRRNDGDRN